MDPRSSTRDAGVVERRAALDGAERARRYLAAPPARDQPRRQGAHRVVAQGLKLADVQGLVYTGYKKLPYAGFLFANFGPDVDATRAWLQAMPIASAAHEVVSKH